MTPNEKSMPYFHVDAFAERPFAGNRAGVCLLEREIGRDLMQKIASETNLAETAFVWATKKTEVTESDGGKTGREKCFHLKWFTPEVEIPLCGHGTLATAHILWQEGWLSPDEEAVFESLGGQLTVSRMEESWLELNFPSFSTSPATLPAALSDLFPDNQGAFFSNDRYLVVLDGEEKVRRFKPDHEKLRAHSVIITSLADNKAGSGDAGYDFVSRYFTGPHGIPEDPVTGSSHCSLGPFWGERLGKDEMLAYQASERGGYLRLKLRGKRILIAGQAVTFVRGILTLDLTYL